MAELVDALVSGTSGATRGGSSPLLGTKQTFKIALNKDLPVKSTNPHNSGFFYGCNLVDVDGLAQLTQMQRAHATLCR